MGLMMVIARSARPINGIMAALAVWTGLAVVEGDPWSLDLPLIFLAASAVFVLSGGNLLNDISDREIDRTAHPDRPLSRGEITPLAMKRAAVGLWSAALILTTIACLADGVWLPLLILNGAMFSLIWYEEDLKSRGLPGNIVVSALIGSTFIFGASLSGSFSGLVLVFSLMATLVNLSRELIKDIEDMEDDRHIRRTFPVINGKGVTVTLVRTIIILAVILSLVPFGTVEMNPMYLVTVAISDMFFILSASVLAGDPSSAQIRAKTGMIFALLAFFSFSLM